jgi:hypothetical protein
MTTLVPTKEAFYGIIPRSRSTLVGQVILLVTFKNQENYMIEYIHFKVASFKTSYHAILGRLALARFVAIPIHTYRRTESSPSTVT